MHASLRKNAMQAMMGAWQGECGKLDQYGMQYSRLFANLCNAGISVETLTNSARATCTSATQEASTAVEEVLVA